MATDTVQAPLEAGQVDLCRELLGKGVARVRENLEMLLGQEVRAEILEDGLEPESEVRKKLPGDACCVTLTPLSGESPALAVLSLPLAHTLMGLSSMMPEEEVARRREEGGHLDDVALRELKEVGPFFAAGLNDEVARLTRTRGNDQTELLVLRASSWDGGRDPLTGDFYVVASGTVTVGEDGAADPFTLLMPASTGAAIAARSRAPDEAPEEEEPQVAVAGARPDPETRAGASRAPEAPEAGTGGPGPSGGAGRAPTASPVGLGAASTVLLGLPRTAEALQKSLQAPVTAVEAPSALLRHLEGGKAPDLLVVQVGRAGDHLLPLAAALRRHPAMAGRPVLILLEHPTPRRVVRCGQLGLMDVVPADLPAEPLRRRVAGMLSRRAGAAA